jgi:TPR repeat protein
MLICAQVVPLVLLTLATGAAQSSEQITERTPASSGLRESIEKTRRAAEAGDVSAQANLAFDYSIGNGVNNDFAQAAHWYLKAAEQGHLLSQSVLGDMYRDGRGVPQDYTKAAGWYRKAAESEAAESEPFRLKPGAQIQLGMLYEKGLGVPADDDVAAKWYHRAVENGNDSAVFLIYFLCRDGKAKGTDCADVVSWLTILATIDDRGLSAAHVKVRNDAEYDLGEMFHGGQGIPKNATAAVKWYRKAGDHGNKVALVCLGIMYGQGDGISQDYAEAAKWYRKAAAQGSAEGQTLMGAVFFEGVGVPQDYTEAARWYRKAAEQGDPDAQFNLGVMYGNGQGLEQDLVQAHIWINLAASHSNGDDQRKYASARDLVATKMTPAQIAAAQFAARQWRPVESK